MNSLALSRSAFGAAVLVAPDLAGGHIDGMTLGPVTRRAMQILGVRHLLLACVCAAAPTRCVLSLEVAVDTVHGLTMAAVSAETDNDSRRRAAGSNVLSAGAFALAGFACAAPPRARRPTGQSAIASPKPVGAVVLSSHAVGWPVTSLQHAFLDGWQPTVFAALKAVARFLTAVAVGAIVGRTATAADTS